MNYWTLFEAIVVLFFSQTFAQRTTLSNNCIGPAEGLYPHPDNSNQFIHCEARYCPPGSLWDNSKKSCKWSSMKTMTTVTRRPTTTTITSTTPTSKPPWFSCPEEDIAATACKGTKDCLYPHPENRNQFIQCVVNPDNRTGTPFVRYCPPGLHWDDSKKSCRWPSAMTITTVTSAPSTTRPPRPISNYCIGPAEGLYPHPDNSNQFIHCEAKYCPPGLQWDDDKKSCQGPSMTTLTRRPTTTITLITLTAPATKPPWFSCPEEDIAATACKGPKDCLYPHPENRNQFIQCEVNADNTTGRPIVRDCPPSLLWDDSEKRCLLSSTMTITTTTLTAPTTKPPWFSCPEEDIAATACKGPKDCLYPHPENRNQFIQCEVNADNTTGRPIVKDCPPSLLWDDSEKRCLLSSTMKMTTVTSSHTTVTSAPSTTRPPSPTTITTLTTPTSKPPGFSCPEEDIAATACKGPKDCLYPHPENCNQFIQCVVNADNKTGHPIVRDCPPSLLWDDSEKSCQWPTSSTCQGRTPPSSMTKSSKTRSRTRPPSPSNI